MSIVVVTYDALPYVQRCLEGVRFGTSVPFELIVVDNASQAETREYLRALPGIRVIFNDQNRLWCAGCNQGMRAADTRSRYVLLLNSDVEILRGDWLDVMLAVMESHPRVGIVGPEHNKAPYAPMYGWIDGHCMLIRRKVLNEVGEFDEERWPWGGAPMEFAVAAFARGWRYKKVHRKDEIVRHHHGASKTPDIREKLDLLPKPMPEYAETMVRYGILPRFLAPPRYRIVRKLRRFAERFRFYNAPPVGRA